MIKNKVKKIKIYQHYLLMNFKMEKFTQDNGKTDKDGEKENNIGKMELSFKDIGKMTR